MKVNETLYNVTLNPKEIDTITNALHACYKETKEQYIKLLTEEHDAHDEITLYNRKNELKEIRDSFANLINRVYMGHDA